MQRLQIYNEPAVGGTPSRTERYPVRLVLGQRALSHPANDLFSELVTFAPTHTDHVTRAFITLINDRYTLCTHFVTLNANVSGRECRYIMPSLRLYSDGCTVI